MVDSTKKLEGHRAKGERLGYCTNNLCDWPNPIYEVDILPAYKYLPEDEQKVSCPKCKQYQLVNDLIPF